MKRQQISSDICILNSLEYLSKEAKISGYEDLHSILECVLNLTDSDNEEEAKDAQHDLVVILTFLKRFKGASSATQQQVLSLIEDLEFLSPHRPT